MVHTGESSVSSNGLTAGNEGTRGEEGVRIRIAFLLVAEALLLYFRRAKTSSFLSS